MSKTSGLRERWSGAVQVGPGSAAVRRLVEPFEPVAWAYLTLDTEGVDARATQVRGVLDQLAAASAPPAALAAIGDRLRHAPVAPASMAVLADSEGNVLHEQQIDDSQRADRAGYSVPADVLALLADDQLHPPYVFVAIDRAGADLVHSSGGAAGEVHEVVVGVDDEIRHTAPGGWASLSQSRLQRRAEDSWKHNAYQVADRVVALAAEVGAQAIIVAGEPHVVHYFRERLPEPVDALVRPVSGSRSAQRPLQLQRAKVRAALKEVEQAQSAGLLADLREGDGEDVAVQGAEDTLAALAAGRVAVLLVDPAVAVARTWFGAEPTTVFATRPEASPDAQPVDSAPLAHVAVRSALMSGAQVRVLPPGTVDGPAGGIGALCRFRLG